MPFIALKKKKKKQKKNKKKQNKTKQTNKTKQNIFKKKIKGLVFRHPKI